MEGFRVCSVAKGHPAQQKEAGMHAAMGEEGMQLAVRQASCRPAACTPARPGNE